MKFISICRNQVANVELDFTTMAKYTKYKACLNTCFTIEMHIASQGSDYCRIRC